MTNPPSADGPPGRDAAGRRDRPATSAARRRSGRSTCGRRSATSGPTRRRCATASRRAGPASTTRRGACPAPRPRMPAGPTGRTSTTSPTSPPGRSSASTYVAQALATGALAERRRTSTAATSTGSTSASGPSGPASTRPSCGRAWPTRTRRSRRARPAPAARDDPVRRGLGLGLPRAPRPRARPPRRSSSRGPTSSAPGRSRATRSRSTGEYVLTDPNGPIERFWAAEGAILRQFDGLVRAVPLDAWERPGVTPGWTLKDHVAHLAAWFDEAADALDAHRARGRLAARARRHRRLERPGGGPRSPPVADRGPRALRARPAPPRGGHPGAVAGRPARPGRLELGLRGPPRPRPGPPRDGRSVVCPGGLAGAPGTGA